MSITLPHLRELFILSNKDNQILPYLLPFMILKKTIYSTEANIRLNVRQQSKSFTLLARFLAHKRTLNRPLGISLRPLGLWISWTLQDTTPFMSTLCYIAVSLRETQHIPAFRPFQARTKYMERKLNWRRPTYNFPGVLFRVRLSIIYLIFRFSYSNTFTDNSSQCHSTGIRHVEIVEWIWGGCQSFRHV